MDLRTELYEDPKKYGYKDFILRGDMAGLTKVLNRLRADLVIPKTTFVTGRSILADLGITGAVSLEKLSVFGSMKQEDPQLEGVRLAVKWAMKFAEQEGEGIDLGHPNTQMLLDVLGKIGVLSKEELDSFNELAYNPSSRAYELFERDVTVTEVTEAVYGN